MQTVTSVDALVKEYSKQYNVSQKEIYEVALVEFFKKYGFEHEIEALLSN